MGNLSMDETQNKIRLELLPEAVDGVYTNFSVITHTTGEFIIDFARITPGKPVARVYSRIIMSPTNFKLFKHAIDENLTNYELKYGKINIEGIDSIPKVEQQPNSQAETAKENETKDSKEDTNEKDIIDLKKRRDQFKKLFGVEKEKAQSKKEKKAEEDVIVDEN